MSKKEIIKSIEDGLINLYINKDQSLYEEAMQEDGIDVNGEIGEYEDMAKKILFLAKANFNGQKIARIISIVDETKKREDSPNLDKSKVITIFNRHIQEYGLAVNYRNLDEMDIEEITDILDQIDLTALLNDLESTIKDE